MPAKVLTAKFCDAVKPEPGRQVAYPDAKAAGLEFRVSGEGRKTWTFRYRTDAGQQKRLTLGLHSTKFGLEEAREAARSARVLVDRGEDPAQDKREKKAKAKADPIRTFDDLAAVYFRACEVGTWRPKTRWKRASTLTGERDVYRLYIKPAIGSTRPESVSRLMLKNMLNELVGRGITSRTNRAHAIVRQIFNFAVAEMSERFTVNPATTIPAPVQETPRGRVYTDAELQAVWEGITSPEALVVPLELREGRRDGEKVMIAPATRIALKLALMLLQRRSEIAGMAVAELDLENGVWLLPPERTKSGRPHTVPLSDDAVTLIREAINSEHDIASP